MPRWLPVTLAAVALTGVTCTYTPPPVPVSGDSETLGFLAGQWSGTYRSDDTGRDGSIFFRLRAGADTAQGEVLMTRRHDLYGGHGPRSPEQLDMPQAIEAPPIVTIRFVTAAGDAVYGSLDEYRDPECGCLLQTTFRGRIERDRLEGTFTTAHLDSGVRHAGTWSVRRTGPPPAAQGARAERPRAEPGPVVVDTSEPGLKGPGAEAIHAQGEALFRDLGCSFCHGAEGQGRIGPRLAGVVEHQSFAWIYRMILNPDSMVRHDPLAKAMYEEYGFAMPDRGADPWQALVLYEYLIDSMRSEPREPREPR